MQPRSLAGRHPLLAGILFTLFLALLCALASTPPASAAVCSKGNVPAATLLVPYFEVDLDTAGGRTTLFSIGSTVGEPTLVNVTLWTDWGIPAFSFYLSLGPRAVQTINLRDVVGGLSVPGFGPIDPQRFPLCAQAEPVPAAITAAELRRRLTGQPDSENGCVSRPRADVELAVGFVTVDRVVDCLPAGDRASVESYFHHDYSGFLSPENTLWGDVTYVSANDDAAQGAAAVPIRSVPCADPLVPRFFPHLDRVATDETWRTRFLSGGPLSTETEVVVWIGGWAGLDFPSGAACSGGADPAFGFIYSLRWAGEEGPLPVTGNAPWFQPLAMTRKVAVGELLGNGLPIGGSFELEGYSACVACPILPPAPVRLPSVVWPVHRAAGRFSAGLEATPTDGACPEVIPSCP